MLWSVCTYTARQRVERIVVKLFSISICPKRRLELYKKSIRTRWSQDRRELKPFYHSILGMNTNGAATNVAGLSSFIFNGGKIFMWKRKDVNRWERNICRLLIDSSIDTYSMFLTYVDFRNPRRIFDDEEDSHRKMKIWLINKIKWKKTKRKTNKKDEIELVQESSLNIHHKKVERKS